MLLVNRLSTLPIKINALNDLHIDDVGSGFASLDTVVEIRPDIVKIDRHLVRELHKDELRYNIMDSEAMSGIAHLHSLDKGMTLGTIL